MIINQSIRVQAPTATMQWSKRFLKNISYFQSNYIFVFAILLIYCILTSPFLLLILGASVGACYLVTLKNRESPVKICSYQLSLTQQYAGIALCAFPFFWLVGAGSAVFWVIYFDSLFKYKVRTDLQRYHSHPECCSTDSSAINQLISFSSHRLQVLGASLFVIGLHASIYAIETLDTEAENKQNDLFPTSIYPPFPSADTEVV